MSNIVDAYPREGVVFRTKPLFQWDYGQIVRLHISDLPASYKVEFSNSTRADAVATVQTTDEVAIPAQFLENGNPIYAWVVVVDEARTTEYSLIIPVSARAKPTDLEPSPEEHTEIEQALSALNQAVEQAAADVEAAGGYAEEAGQSAEAAVTASEAAIDAKNTAETKASEAATAAQNAGTSASQANTSAQNAAGSASAATTAKNAAESAAESVAGAMATLEATIQADLQAAKESGEFDGPQGQQGEPGQDGAPGADGMDGISPTATVTKSGKTATIRISDKNGVTTANVLDGNDGPPGIAYIPAVSSEGVISWTNTGGVPNPQSVNIKGPKGDTGETGETGPKGDPGDDYVLTAADKAEIAQQAAEEVDVPVQDVQVNGTSILNAQGVANIPLASANAPGVVQTGTVQVSGTTPSITAQAGIQYICGEVATLNITLPASGCIDVIFQSGSAATVLTVTPPSGVTTKWTNGFDPTSLEANTTYELNIQNGLGVAASWT